MVFLNMYRYVLWFFLICIDTYYNISYNVQIWYHTTCSFFFHTIWRTRVRSTNVKAGKLPGGRLARSLGTQFTNFRTQFTNVWLPLAWPGAANPYITNPTAHAMGCNAHENAVLLHLKMQCNDIVPHPCRQNTTTRFHSSTIPRRAVS